MSWDKDFPTVMINRRDRYSALSNAFAQLLHSVAVAVPRRQSLTAAYGINDAGQIVGYGTLKGQQRAFLLTPR